MSNMLDTVGNAISTSDAEFQRELPSYVERVKGLTTPLAAEAYINLKELADRYEAVGKVLNTAVTELKQVIIPQRFEAEGVSSFTTTSGYRVTISSTPRATMADKVNGTQWLKDNNLGDIVTETVNASTLSAVAGKLLEEGRELPQEYFRTYLQPNTSVTKVGKKAA